MKRKTKLGTASNLIVSNFAIIAFFGIGIAFAFFKFPLAAGACFFLSLLGVVSRLWGGAAMRGLSAEASCAHTRMFPGETTRIDYSFTNDKSLPLIWLEVSQLAPENDCLVPDEGFEYFIREYNAKEGTVFEKNVRQKFSFILGHSGQSYSSVWTAKRRGFYEMNSITLRSGDGFGMTQAEQAVDTLNIPDFVIYPKPTAVDITPFLMDQWECVIGTKGYVEDPTILRGIRDYQTGDSWKRINWRNLARQHELKVNMYEISHPKALHFIIDAESFAHRTADNRHLEAMFEIISSAFVELFEAGVACGISLPKSKRFPALTLPPTESRTLEERLFYFAGYDFANELDKELSKPSKKIYLPAQFDVDGAAAAAMISGRTYYICFVTPKELPPMLQEVDPSRAAIYSVMDSSARPPYDIPVHSISSIRRDHESAVAAVTPEEELNIGRRHVTK